MQVMVLAGLPSSNGRSITIDDMVGRTVATPASTLVALSPPAGQGTPGRARGTRNSSSKPSTAVTRCHGVIIRRNLDVALVPGASHRDPTAGNKPHGTPTRRAAIPKPFDRYAIR